MQVVTLKRHMLCPYEFIVFNDAKSWPDWTNFNDTTLKQKITAKCTELGIQCIEHPNDHHKGPYYNEPSHRAADTMNSIWEYMKAHPAKYFILDSDMILISDFNPLTRYTGYDAAIYEQTRNLPELVRYIWPNVFYFDTQQAPHQEIIDWRCMPRLDTGGMTRYWMASDPKLYYMTKWHICDGSVNHIDMIDGIEQYPKLGEWILSDPRNGGARNLLEIVEDHILHYQSACNWRREGRFIHQMLISSLKKIILK
jgi:hypothetical protein